MKKLKVDVSTPYEVMIGKGLLHEVGEYVAKIKNPCKAVIITDVTVNTLYGEMISKSLEEKGFSVITFSFASGEKSKTLETASKILNFLAENEISKSDILLAVGGGVVGDITGFCASIYLRGLQFIQIPTTILSAVDSSVGGKTGVDLQAGKNLVGAFHHPLLVLCDIDTFNTLDEEIRKDGLCEVIKYGCILDKDLFQLMIDADFEEYSEEIIERCVRLKAEIVCQDEFDNGIRQILNYGHTIGHAIESLSDYSISHGKAVGMGMYMIEKAAGSGLHLKIDVILKKYGIESKTTYSSSDIYQKAKRDKKISRENINLILLEEIGKAKILTLPMNELEEFLSKGDSA